MGAILQDAGDQFLSMRADLSCPADEPRGGPFEIFLMGFGHVFGQGGILAFLVAPEVKCHSSVLEEDLDGCRSEADIKCFPNELIGDAIIMAGHLDMVIDVNLRSFPIGIDIRLSRERFESRLIQSFKENLAGGFEFLKPTVVEHLQLFLDGLIEFGEAEESAVPQRSQDRLLYL
jgi:hypothetical protein